jgi:hypothetical protein
MSARRTFPRRRLSWWLLIHQLPPRPLYLRAKIRQRLARVGAVALKNSVYVLPRREDCLEDFQWIAEEAISGGGEAFVCEAAFPDARMAAALKERFRTERDAEYRELGAELRRARSRGAEAREIVSRARRRLEEIRRIDYFGAPGGRRAAALVQQLEDQRAPRSPEGGTMARSKLRGKTWTTRRGVKVDRIASAWLVRRFVDARAKFRFVDPAEAPVPGEVRFDMVGGDFTHEGDRCTFETLLGRARLKDSALRRVAEIVHDIDVKDGKFGRPETPGVERLIRGLATSDAPDEVRLEQGFLLFDQLYESFRPVPRKRARPKA